MVFINNTGIIGTIINSITTNITGSLFMTLLLILILLMAMALLFRIPLEYTATLILPMLLVLMAYSGQFLAIGGVLLIYIAIIFAKMFFLR